MPKDTKTLGNSKARACESLGFVHKKGCARVLTQPLSFLYTLENNFLFLYKINLKKPFVVSIFSPENDSRLIK